ncbi:alkaline phosphatase family protein [Salipiger sp. P9]|uniref:alkaline phosphatase family protein n=1 Tax=Salipiger pentaromativorans TaxID=2943193 RepID=UPI002157C0B4|nr:alkaline phosphatase family protein [Salipiger pentaromativorans]MCR8546935.1 alkaline phosphatase family protein [Salipiger pentaromativorans]
MTTHIDKAVVVVFDGLRPDLIDDAMPNLRAFADESLRFTNARSVFPSLTRVCTTSLATGSWPERHGIVGNAFHMPEVVPGRPLDTSDFTHLARMREVLGEIVTTDSLGQALARAGKRMATVHAGSPGSAFLVNHDAARNGHWTFSVHGADKTQTPEAVERAIAACGPLPGGEIPKVDAVAYAGRVMRELAIAQDRADVAWLWLPEPDTSFHYREIGSEASREARRAADLVFGEIVHQIRSGPESERTAIVALSDHGQISTVEEIDLGADLTAAGLSASSRPGAETKFAMTDGAAGELRALDGDPGLLRAAVSFLREHPKVAAVFARDALCDELPGALPQSLVRHGHARQPDLFYVMRSDEAPDAYGITGRRAYTGGVPLGGGMHGGLNRHEMATTMIWQVPGGRTGHETAPAALVDVAPTLAALMGLALSADGRALPLMAAETEAARVLETPGQGGDGAFVLRRMAQGGRIYLDCLEAAGDAR